MAEENLNLYQKLAKIRKIADVVAKDKRGYNYSYADITAILAKITAGLEKYGVSLIPMIEPGTANVTQNTIVNTKFDKTGKTYDQTVTEMLVTAQMTFRWVNDENPEEVIDVPWFITGSQGDPSQAFGSSLTYCTRYFMTSYFQIAQVDSDVDAYRSKQKEAEDSEKKAVLEGIIQEIDTAVKLVLADNSNSTDEVKKFLSNYVKDSNYLKIKEPAIAAKLLEDFKNTYMNAEEK